MKFTGINTLYTPRLLQVTYLFKDIVVDSTGLYHVGSSHNFNNTNIEISTGWLFHLKEGRILDPSGKFVSTYNTGEVFSISGWIDFPTNFRYLQVGEIITRSQETGGISGLLGAINVWCPTGNTSGTMTCDILLNSTRITTDMAFDAFIGVGLSVKGYFTTSIDQYITNDAFQFYNSYEPLITGNPVIAFLSNRFPPLSIVSYQDNDTSNQNNTLNFNYQYRTIYGDPVEEFLISRTGLYNSGISQVVSLNSQTGFSGLFDGVWSGNQFVYQDAPNTIIFNYLLNLSDGMGNPYPKSGRYTVSIQKLGQTMVAEYITGFSLTTGGEYLSPPLLATTGYYYCTGIQQSIGSLLFSSGCTGDLSVSFVSANGKGTGASGLLQTTPVTFNGVYFGGNKVFRTVYGYVTTNVGTGYTIAPQALVNTGQYGIACFDVPLASGYNQAWFAPFRTSGTIDVEAGWFTGVALCRTGLVSGGLLTGYIVTGIDVYNIGSGFSNIRPPLLSFIRTGESILTRNASGSLFTNTGSVNSSSDWYVEAGVAGTSAILSGQTSGTVPLGTFNNLLSIKIMCSGVDITVPITGNIVVTMSNVSPSPSTIDYFSFSKYFNTDPYALKKKNSPTVTFAINSDLSFLLTQNELDTLYTDAGYTNNSWTLNEGDFDF